MNSAIIILAAGASTRLGGAKQTLEFLGQSLLNRAIKAAADSDIGPVIVVLGANATEISATLNNGSISIVYNENYHQGIASSIKAGLNHMFELDKDCENAVLMVCDQPYVDEKLLRTLLDTKLVTKMPLVACSYSDTIGVPALFDKQFFSELLSLQGEEGGKKVLLKHRDFVAVVPFIAGKIDIDTAADYNKLIIGGS